MRDSRMPLCEWLVPLGSGVAIRTDQGCPLGRMRGNHPSGSGVTTRASEVNRSLRAEGMSPSERLPGIMGLQELCLNVPAGNGGGPYLRRFALRAKHRMTKPPYILYGAETSGKQDVCPG